MSLANEVKAILLNQYTSRINFSFEAYQEDEENRRIVPRININRSTFERVARAINDDSIEVKRMPRRGLMITTSSGRRVRVDGGYISRDRILWVKSPIGRQHESTIVHEAVHASFHLTNSASYMWHVDGEAAAYIAGNLYCLYTGRPLRPSSYSTPHGFEIHRIARRIASQIHQTGEINVTTLERLCTLISAHPAYR